MGASCAASLVRSGIGFLRILDFDIVEESNLNRQVLYEKGDVGRTKVEVAKEKLLKINPFVQVEALNKKIEIAEDIEQFVQGLDLLILCADEPKYIIDRLVNRVAKKQNIPWISGGYASTVINFSLFLPNESPCFECIHLNQSNSSIYRDTPMSAKTFGSRNAVTAPIASLTGNLVANEATLHLTKLAKADRKKIFQLDLFSLEVEHIPIKSNSTCPYCFENINKQVSISDEEYQLSQ